MKVGLILKSAFDEQLGRPPSFLEIRDSAQHAEQDGIDSVWIYDHLIHRFPGRPAVGFWEAWTTLSAIASVTERVGIGTWVVCTAFRNPALLAKMADTLDEVSNGRLTLGLGAGWHKPEFDAFGYPFDHRASRFEEALDIILSLLRTGYADFAGAYYRAIDCELQPRGPRPTGPPVLIGAFGPRMLSTTAKFADGWNVDWLGPAELLDNHRVRLNDACTAVGRDPKEVGITGSLSIAFPDLGPLPSWLKQPEQYLTGSADHLAESLHQYRRRGISEVMCACYPNVPQAISRLAEAVRVLNS